MCSFLTWPTFIPCFLLTWQTEKSPCFLKIQRLTADLGFTPCCFWLWACSLSIFIQLLCGLFAKQCFDCSAPYFLFFNLMHSGFCTHFLFLLNDLYFNDSTIFQRTKALKKKSTIIIFHILSKQNIYILVI